MRGLLEQFGTSLAVSAALHGALVLFLVMSLDRSVPVNPVLQEEDIIEATVVDEALVEAELARIREAEQLHIQEVEDARRLTERLAAERVQEERRLRELREQQARERQQAEVERERRQREQAEREARERLERERQAEAARQRQAELDRQRREAEERARSEQAARERLAREAEEAARRETLRQQAQALWMAEIRAQVERNWTHPDQWPPGTTCTVRVSLIPGGEVVAIRFLSSCGDQVRDRSVESAVLRASPLPTPQDPSVFSREVDLVFRPVN